MNMNFKTLAAICAFSFMMTGCNDPTKDNSDAISSPLLNGNSSVEHNAAVGGEDNGDPAEVEEPINADCSITFSNGNIDVQGNGAAVKDNTVTISKSGTYSLSGSSDNAKVMIEAGKNDEVTLMLNGVSLTSADGAVIDCEGGKTLALYLVQNTENKITDSADYTFPTEDTEPDGAIFSRADLVIMGEGSLPSRAITRTLSSARTV